MNIATASTLTAFDVQAVGSKVLNHEKFLKLLEEALKTFAFPVSGQGMVPLNVAATTVSCGDVRRSDLREYDYVVRKHRGICDEFARRDRAPQTESLSVLVYTGSAYRNDPQVRQAEIDRVHDADYVIVAVLASVCPTTPPMSARRFVANLAGGNPEWTEAGGCTMAKVGDYAKKVDEHEDVYVGVAD